MSNRFEMGTEAVNSDTRKQNPTQLAHLYDRSGRSVMLVRKAYPGRVP